MASSRGDVFDVEGLSDDDLYQLVVEQLREHPEVDPDWIQVRVHQGHVTLEGRVGSDAEVQVAEIVVTELLGVQSFTNELMVDELHRGEMPEAADEALAADLAVDDQRGEGAMDQSDTAEHLVEDLQAETYGTHSITEAISEGISYSPPDRPSGEGYGSRENH